MDDVLVVIKDYKNVYTENVPEEKVIKYNFNNNETILEIINNLNLQDSHPRVLTDGHDFNTFDFLYTNNGIMWNVDFKDVTIADFKKTFPNKEIEINIFEQGLGAANGFDYSWVIPILLFFGEYILSRVLDAMVEDAQDSSRRSKLKKNKFEMEEFNTYLEMNRGIKFPTQFYRSIYNRNAWDIEEFKTVHCFSDELAYTLLIGMGYEEVGKSNVFKVNPKSKDEVLTQAEKIQFEYVNERIRSECNDSE